MKRKEASISFSSATNAPSSKSSSRPKDTPTSLSFEPEPFKKEWLEIPIELQTIDFENDTNAASWDKYAPYNTDFHLPITPPTAEPIFTSESPALCFHVNGIDGRARATTIHFPNSGPPVTTPRFMPVGTKGTLKGVLPDEIQTMKCPIILANTYHLAIQPGTELIDSVFGGLHNFMGATIKEDNQGNHDNGNDDNGNKKGRVGNNERTESSTTSTLTKKQGKRLYNLLTDSGGFQMVSLASLSQVTEEGVIFESPYTHEPMMLKPEDSIRCQNEIGADIIMQLDDVISSVASDEERFRIATFRTLRWYDRCIQAHQFSNRQNLFPIMQGHLDTTKGGLRELCLAGFKYRDLHHHKIPGFAIGGLAGGESKEEFWKVVDHACRHLPDNRPRYLMGVGYPVDLVVCTALGVDLYDCVYPTRTARFGVALVDEGQIKLKQHEHAPGISKDSNFPIDTNCICEACKRSVSKGRLHSLLKANNSIAVQLITQHNVTYMMGLVTRMREAILEHRFHHFVKEFLEKHFRHQQDEIPKWVQDALNAAGVSL